MTTAAVLVFRAESGSGRTRYVWSHPGRNGRGGKLHKWRGATEPILGGYVAECGSIVGLEGEVFRIDVIDVRHCARCWR